MDINKILGKKKGTKSVMPKMNFSGLVKNTTTGASMFRQNQWKQMTAPQRTVARAKYPDTDGDRVPNRFDCSPRNAMRQDNGAQITEQEIKEVQDFDNMVQNRKLLSLEDQLVTIYENSRGNGYGWPGIGKEDPENFRKALNLARNGGV